MVVLTGSRQAYLCLPSIYATYTNPDYAPFHYHILQFQLYYIYLNITMNIGITQKIASTANEHLLIRFCLLKKL